MIDQIYVERAVRAHPRTRAILKRFSRAVVTECERYGEIFNRRGQNFRLQKRNPALVLAEKFGRCVLPAPPEYAIGGAQNYYFSHALNCPYDCRYCFLQGMYRSAHYVLFVNYERFMDAIEETAAGAGDASVHFFSGYDCDSLALDRVSGFTQAFLPVFRRHPQALLELRTKSVQIRSLLAQEPLPNCVVAYSFTPPAIAAALEHGAPPVGSRIRALRRLQERGWLIGLRFDPLIYHDSALAQYQALFARIFEHLDADGLHSVSLGGFRLPRPFYRTLARLYPEDALFSSPLEETEPGMVAYRQDLQDELMSFCARALLEYVPEERLFPCQPLPPGTVMPARQAAAPGARTDR